MKPEAIWRWVRKDSSNHHWKCLTCNTTKNHSEFLECECNSGSVMKSLKIFIHSLERKWFMYREDQEDYGNKNGGQRFPSWIVSNGFMWGGSGYIKKGEDARQYIHNKVETELKETIEETERHLTHLKQDYELFKKEGIEAFKVERL